MIPWKHAVAVGAAAVATVLTVALLPTTGEPKVSPVPSQGLVPRHEGNPIAPSSFTLGSGNWVGQWVFTEPLTSCTVDIKGPCAGLSGDVVAM